MKQNPVTGGYREENTYAGKYSAAPEQSQLGQITESFEWKGDG